MLILQTYYYKEPVFRNGTSAIPMIYDRTYKLLNSLIKTDIVKSGVTISCSLEIDPNYFDYQYMGVDSATRFYNICFNNRIKKLVCSIIYHGNCTCSVEIHPNYLDNQYMV